MAGSETSGPSVNDGFHLDTVAQGGRFDGTAESWPPLRRPAAIQEGDLPHHLPIELVVFAEEEGGRFGWGLLGSSAWTGKNHAGQLAQIKDREGVGYLEAMEEPESKSGTPPLSLRFP